MSFIENYLIAFGIFNGTLIVTTLCFIFLKNIAERGLKPK